MSGGGRGYIAVDILIIPTIFTTNSDSFINVKHTLIELQRWDDIEAKPVLIVANKLDLVRTRCIEREGMSIECVCV